tara:strand:+ start:117 stop:392 length:276 start_codon:yes stop_codon:yes gene_type:complete
MKSTTRVLKNHIELLGYRVCVACDDPVWICSAKNDEAGQFFVAKSDTEDREIAELCELIGIDLADGQAWRSRAFVIWTLPDKQVVRPLEPV